MELKDLVLGKKYNINKPEGVKGYPFWRAMDHLDEMEVIYGYTLYLRGGVLHITDNNNDDWEACPTWLTEVCEDTHESITPKTGDFLKCIKSCCFEGDREDDFFITKDTFYEITEISGNSYVHFMNDSNFTHNWNVNDKEFEEYFTVIPKEEYDHIGHVFANRFVSNTEQPKTPVKSDGGSSDYYKLKMRLSSDQIKTVDNHPELTDVTFVTGDVIRALVDSDFDLGNIIKAVRRIHQAKKGEGKQGVSVEYDCKKIDYFLKEWYDNYQKEQI